MCRSAFSFLYFSISEVIFLKNQTKLCIFTALFAALSCVATMLITIPTPTGGFVHLGDGMALLCGWLLGPIWGALAAGLGGMMADFFSGFPLYAPATFIIKGAMAAIAYFMYKMLKKHHIAALIAGGVIGEIFMIFGYFMYEMTVCGYGFGAIVGVPANGVQGAMGVISGVILIEVVKKTRIAQKMSIKKGILDHDRND